MPAPTFLALVGGIITRLTATPLGGAGNEEKVVSTDSEGFLANSLLRPEVGQIVVSAQASEAIAEGAPINFHTVSGALRIRNADGSAAAGGAKECQGFAPSAIASGATGNGVRTGRNTKLSGLTPGAKYYLGAAPGTYTTTPLNASGQTSQVVGVAFSATALDVLPGPAIGL